ncbi:MAG: methyltransferase domain-containing protein, partial [Nanoarchaeota archaeon]
IFIEDCRYYDQKNIETNTILKYVKVKGKTLLDIGCGIGRHSFPLAKYAEIVIALDKDKRFLEYFNKHKKRNVIFINKKAEKYLRKRKKFDIILLAWPTDFNSKFIRLIKKFMHENSIFMTCNNSSDFESIIDKLNIIKKSYNKDIKKKFMFINLLTKKFKLLMKKKIFTEYLYPNKQKAFRIIKNNLKLFSNIKLNKNQQEKLKDLINKHKIGKKIKFDEEVWFYLLTLK